MLTPVDGELLRGLLHIERDQMDYKRALCARCRYLKYGYIIMTHIIWWDVITYPCHSLLRGLLLIGEDQMGLVCQKRVPRTCIRNYIRQNNEWIITYPCHILLRGLLHTEGDKMDHTGTLWAKSRYLGHGWINTSHRIVWDVMTYPSPRY